MIRKLYLFFLIFPVISSCTSIKIYKPNTYGTSTYFVKVKSKFEEFTFDGKDTFSLRDKENQKLGIENIIPDPRKARICMNDTFIKYTYKNNESDTFYLNKDQFFLARSINPFCITLPTTICNGVYVSNQHRNHYLVRYIGDSIHYFNNQPPVNTYIFEYIGLPNGKIEDTLASDDPIFVEVSSADGVIVGATSTFLVPMEFETKETYSYSLMDYRKVFTSRKRLQKFLM